MSVTKEQVIEFIAGMTVLELSELIKELEDKFGGCELEYLFLAREDAAAMTAALNRPEDEEG